MSENNDDVPISRSEYDALLSKLDSIDERFAKAAEEQDAVEAAEFQDRLDKIEGTLDTLLKEKEEEAGALIDGETGVLDGAKDEEDLGIGEDEESRKKRKEKSKGDLTSRYSQDADVVDTKEEPGTANKSFKENLVKRLERLERGQALIKGPGSEGLNDEGNAGSYMKSVIGAQYGFSQKGGGD